MIFHHEQTHQLSYSSLPYIEQECQESLILGKIHIQQNWNEYKYLYIKLNFRELCCSKLSGLHPLDNMAVIH